MTNLTRKVALFDFGGSILVSERGSWMEKEGNPRVSEEVEITFTELPKEQIILQQVKKIDKEIEELKETTLKKLEALTQQKEELLALTHINEE